MNEILAITLNSMHQDMERLDHIGTNLVNANTPGYKREVIMAHPFAQVFDEFATRMQGDPSGSISSNLLSLINTSLMVQSDLTPGTLKSTGQSLDLALVSEGYFEVETPSGTAYTRQGSFHVDARGRLVTAQGYAVMGTGGEIILNNETPVIDASGNVFEASHAQKRSGALPNAQALTQLKVVRFDKPEALQRLGNGLLTSTENVDQMSNSDIRVRQGFLENSNVSSMREMTQLMETMRHFESMQKIATGYDEIMATAIHKLGDLS